jgi:hypothetical protein
MRTAEKVANTILAGAGFLCVGIVFYYSYHYLWSRDRHFTEAIGLVIYLIIPGALACLFFVSLRWKPAYKVNLSLSCSSFIFSLLVAEGWLLWISSAEPEIATRREALLQAAQDFGMQLDTRTPLEFIRDLKSAGIDSVPAVAPINVLKQQNDGSLKPAVSVNGVEFLPLGGIANTVTVLCNETGQYVTYHSDEHGLHNPKGLWELANIDVAAVGDSYTSGFCVPSDKNAVALIRRHYPATVNLGMGGNGSLAQLASVKEYLPSLKPKFVLWFHFEGNDLEDLKRESKSTLLRRYLEIDYSQGLVNRQREIDLALRQYVDSELARKQSKAQRSPSDYGVAKHLSRISGVVRFSHLRERLGLAHGMHTADKANLELFSQILRQAKASIARWDGKLLFVYLPAWERYSQRPMTDENRQAVRAITKTLDIPMLDVHATFRATADPLASFPFRLGMAHYTEHGYRLVAESILGALSDGTSK